MFDSKVKEDEGAASALMVVKTDQGIEFIKSSKKNQAEHDRD